MAEPIRVAQVMGKMVGGGVEQVVMNYYRHIDRSKVRFDFIVDEDSTLVPREEIESLGGKVFIVPPYQHVVAYQKALIELFREHGWKIVHSHENALSVFPLRAAKKAGVPVRIAHSHSTSGKGEHARNAAKWILKHFSRVYPTDFAACGEHAGAWLFGRSQDFTVIPNAIELDRFAFDAVARDEVREELGIYRNAFVIGHLGRFVKQKNHVFLLKVFARAHEKHPNSMLVLAGTGPLLEESKHLASELGVSDSVLFLGQRNDAGRLYQAFDCFALPSLYEGFCVVGVEAQAAGLPCLFSDAITREVGLSPDARFLPFNLNAWANVIVDLASRGPSSRKMASPVRTYDIDCAAERLEKRYLDLAGEVAHG